jgi:amidase
VFNFETPMEKYQLDAILSINNNNSGHAAAVNYLALRSLWVTKQQENHGDLHFIARPYQEDALLKMGFAFEKQHKTRKLPNDYK